MYAAALALGLCHLFACSSERDRDPAPAEASGYDLERLARSMLEHIAQASTPDAGVPDASAPRSMGEFELTYYWMAHEGEPSTVRDVVLYTRHCEELVTVSRAFADRLALEGTGRLQDGRTINAAGSCDCDPDSSLPCFFVVSRAKRWGVGVAKRPLSPYRSVAVDPDVIPIGTRLYIPALDGLTMPGRRPYGGFVHDGCVIADDTGSRVGHEQLDLFMAFKAHYESFDRRHRLKRIEVFDGEQYCNEPREEGLPAHRNAT